MFRLRTFILALLLAGSIFPAAAGAATGSRECTPPGKGCGQPGHQCDGNCSTKGDRRPYGDYCCNQQSGWYGERREVTSERQARSILENYFAGRQVTIGPFKERPIFYEAEVFSSAGKKVDKVIVHKRSGRIRSIF